MLQDRDRDQDQDQDPAPVPVPRHFLVKGEQKYFFLHFVNLCHTIIVCLEVSHVSGSLVNLLLKIVYSALHHPVCKMFLKGCVLFFVLTDICTNFSVFCAVLSKGGDDKTSKHLKLQ